MKLDKIILMIFEDHCECILLGKILSVIKMDRSTLRIFYINISDID